MEYAAKSDSCLARGALLHTGSSAYREVKVNAAAVRVENCRRFARVIFPLLVLSAVLICGAWLVLYTPMAIGAFSLGESTSPMGIMNWYVFCSRNIQLLMDMAIWYVVNIFFSLLAVIVLALIWWKILSSTGFLPPDTQEQTMQAFRYHVDRNWSEFQAVRCALGLTSSLLINYVTVVQYHTLGLVFRRNKKLLGWK